MDMQTEPRPKWPALVILALICATALSFGYLYRQRRQTQELAAANQTLNASLTQMRHDLESVTGKLNDVLATQSAPLAPQVTPVTPRPKSKARSVQIRGSIVKRAPEDPRWGKIENQLTDQQKQIESTREDLGKARDELSTSIARNHDELVILEKRGERNYVEFKLDKSKLFQRVGPVRLSLRKANLKHKSFDLAMMVDDNELQKKSVNLYEPVWINLSGEQLELIVNQINKDHIQGYLSEPKYKRSELARIQ